MKISVLLILCLFLRVDSLFAGDFKKAPPSFESEGIKYAPIDIVNMKSTYTFDVNQKKTFVEVLFDFQIAEDARPIFDSCCLANLIEVNGSQVSELTVKPYPGTSMKSMDKVLDANKLHSAKVAFVLQDGVDFDFQGTPLKAGFFMSDLEEGGRSFWEKYGLANLEFDSYPHKVEVKILGDIEKEMMLVTNGVTEQISKSHWVVNYPEYFTTSSAFFHLFEKSRFCFREKDYQGLEKSFPIRTYASSCASAENAMSVALDVIEELESDYGAYAHENFTAYIASIDGGMEYCGATITTLWALPHEITHSWFARGVMPADGNAGWMDEAIASWRDNEYPRYESLWWTAKLAGFHPYQRHTVMASYTNGASFIGHLDYLLQSFGMKSLLKDFYHQNKRSVVQVKDLQNFLEQKSSQDLKAKFDTYVYGLGVQNNEEDPNALGNFWNLPRGLSKHPKPFKKEDLKRLR